MRFHRESGHITKHANPAALGARPPAVGSAYGVALPPDTPVGEPDTEVKYLKVDNAFAGLSDVVRAQQISDQFPSVDWVRVLGRYARRINPLLGELLRPMEYYWVTAQAEYSTGQRRLTRNRTEVGLAG
jgi:hypothetical protein